MHIALLRARHLHDPVIQCCGFPWKETHLKRDNEPESEERLDCDSEWKLEAWRHIVQTVNFLTSNECVLMHLELLQCLRLCLWD